MFKRLTKIEKMLEEFKKDTDVMLHSIDKTLVKQEENLKQHMYRTELAERRLELIETDMKPMRNHLSMYGGVVKTFGAIALIVTIGAGIVKILAFVIQ